jgi:hypothetical protein
MLKFASSVVAAAIVFGFAPPAISQAGSPSQDESLTRVVVGSADNSSDSVITIPAETSWTAPLSATTSKKPDSDPVGLARWIESVQSQNGLQSPNMRPWHLIIQYDQFDEDGDNIHSGTIEEFWAGPKLYKIGYKSDSLNQTDYATENGVFRDGDQRWPNRAEMQARTEIVDPFMYASTLQDVSLKTIERTFGTHTMKCTVLARLGSIGAQTQYCFDPSASALRYIRGEGWFQTTYNDIAILEGRAVGREVEVTDGGHPYLTLNVTTLEALSGFNASDFVPPATAINLSGKRITGVSAKAIQTAFPEWPESLRGQHFSVTVEIVIGKDGHVISAHAASGLPAAYKAAENTAKKWKFQPYLVGGESTEVESKIILSNN